jgi:hypothetical protein
MKPNHARRTTGGFSGWDALAVVVVVMVATFLLLPASRGCKAKAGRISCVNGLKQIGLAYRMWANDNSGQFPWVVEPSSTNGGTLSYAASTNVWRHFQIISNEINTPKVCVCPDDLARTKVQSWDAFTNNSHLSYFLGMDADETKPQTILSGDRNLSVSNTLLSGFVRLPTNAALEWTKKIHQRQGNLGLGDGSVQQINSGKALERQYQAASLSLTQAVLSFSLPQ